MFLYNPPLVSVIVPAYNAEAFIGQTLESIISQTYRNIEVLVVDDGSQDQTAEIVKLYCAKDPRVSLLQQSNAGVAAARNLAIQNSRGEHVAPVDADDIWYPQKLEKQMQCMLEAEPSVGLVYAWSVDIDSEGLLTGGSMAFTIEGEVYTALVYSNFLGNASVPLIRRTCLEQVGYYNCQLKESNAQGCEDRDLYLRIAECYRFRVVPKFLIGYRRTISSMSFNFTAMEKSHLLVLAGVRQRHPEIPATIYRWSTSNFYVYLVTQSRRCGNHQATLHWLYKALSLDPVNFLRLNFYRILVRILLQTLAQPVASLVLPGDRTGSRLKLLKTSKDLITISEIESKTSRPQRFVWKPDERIRSRRWSQVLQHSQTLFSSDKTHFDNSLSPSFPKGTP